MGRNVRGQGPRARTHTARVLSAEMVKAHALANPEARRREWYQIAMGAAVLTPEQGWAVADAALAQEQATGVSAGVWHLATQLFGNGRPCPCTPCVSARRAAEVAHA